MGILIGIREKYMIKKSKRLQTITEKLLPKKYI